MVHVFLLVEAYENTVAIWQSMAIPESFTWIIYVHYISYIISLKTIFNNLAGKMHNV